MSILFLTKNKHGKFTRWASANDAESFNKMVEMSKYCKQMHIHIKWIRNEKGELIKNESEV